MLETLKKKAMKSAITQIAIALVIAIGSLFLSNFAFITYLKGPVDFVPGADYADYEGKYVTYEVEYAITDFMTYSTVNTDTKVETLETISYLIYDANEYYFFGAEFDDSKEDELNAQIDETFDWIAGDIDQVSKKIKVTGTFTKLTGQALTYYDETLTEFGDLLEEDFSDISIPYYIQDGKIAGHSVPTVFVFAAFTIIPLLYAIYLAIRLFTGSSEKYLNKFISANTGITMEHIEADFAASEKVSSSIWVGRKYTIYFSGIYAHILDNKKLVWAYYYKRTGKHAESLVRTFDINKKLVNINCSESIADAILQNYATNQPHMMIGYDKQNEKTYKKDFQTFLTFRYNEAIAATNEDPFIMF